MPIAYPPSAATRGKPRIGCQLTRQDDRAQRPSPHRLGCLVRIGIAGMLMLCAGPALMAGEKTAAKAMAPERSAFPLTGTRVHVQLSSGKVLKDVAVIGRRLGQRPETVAAVTVANPEDGQPLLLNARDVQQLKAVDGSCHLVLDGAAAVLVPRDTLRPSPAQDAVPPATSPASNRPLPAAETTAQDAEAQRQREYEETGVWRWLPLTPEQQMRALAEQKKYLQQVGEEFKPTKMHLFEQQRFLFYTDMSGKWVLAHARYLDNMYKTLCGVFGIDPRSNIWYGKALVIAFEQKPSYVRFEQKYFPQSTMAEKTVGLAHQDPDGQVVISCWLGNNAADFANTLVHETVHGFLHRYKSRQNVPNWVNEGAAEWIAIHVTGGSGFAKRRQQAAVSALAAESWEVKGRFFSAANIKGEEYGLAFSLTDFLLRTDKAKYKRLMDGIKTGDHWEECLRAAYGWSVDDLVRRYAGDPGLLPDLGVSADGIAQLHVEADWREAGQKPVWIIYDHEHDSPLKDLLCQEARRVDSPFRVIDSSVVSTDPAVGEDPVRELIRKAEQVAVLCGEHTEKSRQVTTELTIAQEENKPYFLLAHETVKSCRRPASAKEDDKLYGWTWLNVKNLVSGAR
ncbi:MAG: hypothetical protein NTY19_50645 [Planctomycetota bacterium]|nr:hypothetical protein [Planctomycetota bacterium]